VHVAIVVGDGALLCMAVETCPSAEQPNPYAPLWCEAQGQENVDAEEPYVACKAVENASDECLLARHACQLSVGAVVPVGPDEQQHADDVPSQVVLPKEKTAGRANDDAEKCYRNGVDVQGTKEERPKIAWSAGYV